MKRVFSVVVCCFGLLFPAFAIPAAALDPAGRSIAWKTLEPGLEHARVAVSFTPSAIDDEDRAPAPLPVSATVSLVRIDPARFDFFLYMASEKGGKTLSEIVAGERFAAAINAGMYRTDHLTSTGYLRSPEHINNNHVAANFGAFFVARPEDETLPRARLLDRYEHDWETALTQYGLVMQNYRMATASSRVVWKQTERRHSIAALSEDAAGNILFLLCPDPVPATDFLKALQGLPLALTTVMYLEGGSEAALYVNAGGVNTVEAGRHFSGLWSGSASLPLPNVLGIRRRAQ